ncbi:MAG: NAD(P)/FAD-dependent oxidoreductase, partial [Eubacterium sp.]|nr:NAD(P)/FAD-dependent oxidoreductase [Eubacterium sp.]
EERVLDVEGLFIAIGQVPDNESFKDVVELENGYVKALEDCKTNTPGIYVAGDCRTKTVRQLTTAASDGAIAAIAASQGI